MNLGEKALQVLKTVAPTLALAVGGPFGPIAAAAVNAALGHKTGTNDPKAVEAALLSATPDQLLALKKADQDFEVQMKQLGIQEEQLQYADIANARARDVATKDWTPKVLAFIITFGFFGVLTIMIFRGVPPNGGDAFLVLLGSLGTAWAGVVGYYFGSSAGSASKDKTISAIAKDQS
jgi:hypothetical protein